MPRPAIILTNPQMGENIGAAARGMLNFGLTDLRLVNPRDGWPNARAVDMSAGALEGGLVTVTVFETLQGAVADLHHTTATTVRPRGMNKPVLTPRTAVENHANRAYTGQKTGFVFGAERTGLTNDEIALCQDIVTCPCNTDFSSLNLGQAVLLMAYEWFQAGDHTPARQVDFGKSAPALQEKLEEFFIRLETALDKGGFFRAPELRPTLVRNIRAGFMRAEPSTQEIQTLQGILSSLTRRQGPENKDSGKSR